MSAANSHAPEIIGNYVIEHALAHGSMGTVYVAHHALTHSRVALKVMRSEANIDKQAEERFLREVRAAAHIGHEGIVKVQDAGKTNEGHLFLAMELLTGETLEERISRGTGERLTGMDWLAEMLEPLMAAHAHSIVHRDLKPANVFIARRSDGTEHIKLLDFGLARDTREKSGTQTGIALGTPYYMSPEQAARPKDVSPASDVWSVGVMMYEILTAHMPFEGETMHAVVIAAATMPHVPCLDRAPTLDPELAALVDACLSKNPLDRPADAGELRARLLPLLDDPNVRAELANAVTRSPSTLPNAGEPEPLRMPFADTAIALAHDSRIQDVYPRKKSGTGLGVWVSTLAALAIVIAGFFWTIAALERNAQKNEAAAAKLPAGLEQAPPDPRAGRERSSAAATAAREPVAAPEAQAEPTAEAPAEVEEPQPSATGSRREAGRERTRARRSGTPTAAGVTLPPSPTAEPESPAAAALSGEAPVPPQAEPPVEAAPAPAEAQPEAPAAAAPSGEAPAPPRAEAPAEPAPSAPPSEAPEVTQQAAPQIEPAPETQVSP
jgi:serine/threonine-protein kinase